MLVSNFSHNDIDTTVFEFNGKKCWNFITVEATKPKGFDVEEKLLSMDVEEKSYKIKDLSSGLMSTGRRICHTGRNFGSRPLWLSQSSSDMSHNGPVNLRTTPKRT